MPVDLFKGIVVFRIFTPHFFIACDEYLGNMRLYNLNTKFKVVCIVIGGPNLTKFLRNFLGFLATTAAHSSFPTAII